MNSYESPDRFTIRLLSRITPPESSEQQKEITEYIVDVIKPEYTKKVLSKYKPAYASIMCSDHYGSIEDLKLMRRFAITAIDTITEQAITATTATTTPSQSYLEWSQIPTKHNTLLKVKVFTGYSYTSLYLLCNTPEDAPASEIDLHDLGDWDYHHPTLSNPEHTKVHTSLIEDIKPNTYHSVTVLERRPSPIRYKVVD